MKKLSLLLLICTLAILQSLKGQQNPQLVKDIHPHPAVSSGSPEFFTEMNGKLYFSAYSYQSFGFELWAYDPSSSASLIKEIRPGSDGASPQLLTRLGNKVYFKAEDELHGQGLWVSDGTEAGTQLVKDIALGGTSRFIAEPIVFKDRLYFFANDGIHGREVWVSDGTETGTQLFRDIYPGFLPSIPGLPAKFVQLNDKLYFPAADLTDGVELWQTDGTPSGTQRVSDIALGILGSYPEEFTVVDHLLYFTAFSESSGRELYVFDSRVANPIAALDKLNLKLYPNPFQDQLYLEYGAEKPYSVQLTDMTGRKLVEWGPYPLGTQKQRLSIPAELVNAWYIVTVRTANSLSSQKVWLMR